MMRLGSISPFQVIIAAAYLFFGGTTIMQRCDAFVLSISRSSFVNSPLTLSTSTAAFLRLPSGGDNNDVSPKPHKAWHDHVPSAASVLVATILTSPLAVLAAEAEAEYEYGSVNAPPLIPIVGGILAIGTALLPVLLRGGEDAFNEIKERDDFGKSKDALDRDRRNKK
mmetsp:Transcript_8412/g.12279  ORF Transcript_8412/g.12279 Transcript_8412/m.12279 type:complete len:168 (+) Transcript_8412:49-552(+)